MIESLAAYGYGGGGSGGAYWAIVAVVAVVLVAAGSWLFARRPRSGPPGLAEHPEGRPPRGEVNTP